MIIFNINASWNPCCSATCKKRKKNCLFLLLWSSLIPPMYLSDSINLQARLPPGPFTPPWTGVLEVAGNCGKGHQGAPEPHYNAAFAASQEGGCGFPASTWVCGLSRSCSSKLALKEVWTLSMPGFTPHLLHRKLEKNCLPLSTEAETHQVKLESPFLKPNK